MKTFLPRWLAGFWLAAASGGVAAVLNDGTTITNLNKLSNANDIGAAVASVRSSNGVLIAEQLNLVDTAPLRTAWYANDRTVTGGVYTIAADFLPAENSARNRGGVIGALSLSSKRGLALTVVPDEQSYFQLSQIDLGTTDAQANESFAHLFNLDGTPASDDFASARALATGYDATRFATFQLEFQAPTAADRQLTNLTATARVLAKVFQPAGQQLGRTIELLTDLPIPSGFDQRVGYFAYLASVFVDGPIGQLDNLTVTGTIVGVPNTAPQVSLVQPPNNSTYFLPVDITLQADASDPDGEIADVRFLANTVVGTATASPYSVVWTNPPAGQYQLRAVARDRAGAETTSAPFSITIISNRPPTVAISAPTNNATFAAPATITITATASDTEGSVVSVSFFLNGELIQSDDQPPYQMTLFDIGAGSYQVRAEATDDRGATDISTTINFSVTQGTPVSPRMSIARGTNNVTIAWPSDAVGFQLYQTTNLLSGWQFLSATSPTVVPVSPGPRFFRLQKP
jgi:hypothetical protein